MKASRHRGGLLIRLIILALAVVALFGAVSSSASALCLNPLELFCVFQAGAEPAALSKNAVSVNGSFAASISDVTTSVDSESVSFIYGSQAFLKLKPVIAIRSANVSLTQEENVSYSYKDITAVVALAKLGFIAEKTSIIKFAPNLTRIPQAIINNENISVGLRVVEGWENLTISGNELAHANGIILNLNDLVSSNFSVTIDKANHTIIVGNLASGYDALKQQLILDPTLQDSCGTLSSANTIYQLSQDVSSTGTCLTVAADNVSIDCQGFRILHANFSSGSGIINTGYNSTNVYSCKFEQQNMTVTAGAGNVGNAALTISLSNNSVVFNNTINTTGNYSFGVQLISANFTNISSNWINTSGNFSYAVGLSFSGINNITDNTIFTQGGVNGYGINLTKSDQNLIINNNASTRGRAKSGTATNAYGIYLTLSANNTVANNTIMTNGTDSANYGIYLITTVTGNVVSGNTITTNGTNGNNGIRLGSAADNNTIANNTITTGGSTTGNTGIILTGSGSVSGNVVSGNTVTTNGTSSNYGISLDGNPAGNNTIANNTITTGGSTTDNYGIYLSSGISSRVVGTVVTGNTVTTSGTSANYGIFISGSNLFNSNNTVANNTVTTGGSSSANYGIFLKNSGNAVISGNAVTGNVIATKGTSTNYGVYIINSGGAGTPVSNNTVANNTVTTNGTAGNNFGIYLASTFGNVVSGNTVTTNGTNTSIGISIDSTATNNTIANNIITTGGNAGNNSGIFITTRSVRNVITGNNVTATGTTDNHGIFLQLRSNNNTVANNTITTFGNFSYGLYVKQSNGSVFANNTVKTTGNLSFGVQIENVVRDIPANNTFYNNIFNTTARHVNITNFASQNNFSIAFNNATNIIGINATGGNFYDNSTVGGLASGSVGCVSTVTYGICDLPFNWSSPSVNNTDFFPLTNITTAAAAADTTPPNNSIIVPLSGTNFSGSFQINASVNDTSPVHNVNLTIFNNTGNVTAMIPMNLSAGSNSSGYWNVTFDSTTLPDGRYNLSVNATDSAATPNTNISLNVSITIDNTVPNATAVVPVNSTIQNGTMLVNASVNDTMSKVFNATFRLTTAPGSTVTAWIYASLGAGTFDQGYWSASFDTLTVPDGNYNITINATDFAGNQKVINMSQIEIDNVPNATIIAPAQNSNVSGNVIINVSANSSNLNILNVNLTISNNTANATALRSMNLSAGSLTSGYWNVTFDSTTLPEGFYNLSANVTTQGTSTNITANVSITIDNTKPNATIVAPVNTSNISGNFLLNVSANDTRSVLNTTFMLYNETTNSTGWHNATRTSGANSEQGYWTVTLDSTAVRDARYNITVNATDTAGNQLVINLSAVVIDNTVPNATAVVPVNSTIQNGTMLVNASVNDTMSKVFNATFRLTTAPGSTVTAWIYASLGAGTFDQGYWSASFDTLTVPDGNYNITINATDFAGNQKVINMSQVEIDNVPNATIIAPARNSNVSGNVIINVSANSSNIKILFVNLTIYNSTGNVTVMIPMNLSSGSLTQGYWNVTFDTTTLRDARYNLSVNATTLGTSATTNITQNVSVIIDNTQPNASVIVPVAGTQRSGVVLINASVNDTLSKVFNATFRLTTSTGSTVTSWIFATLGAGTFDQGYWNATFDTTTVGDGNYNITVNATDFAGNQNVSNISQIIVENSLPNITIILPVANSNVSGSATLINASINDSGTVIKANLTLHNNTGNATYWIAMNLSSGGTSQGYWNATFDTTTLRDAIYNISVNATDDAGNSTLSVNTSVTIDNTAPNATTISPANQSNLSGAVTVRAGANDSLTGIVNVTFQFRNSTNQTSKELATLNTGTILAGEWTASYNTAQLADGTYNITFNATDFAGNANISENVSVNIDNTAPVILAVRSLSNMSGHYLQSRNTSSAVVAYFNSILPSGNSDGGGGQEVTIEVTYSEANPHSISGNTTFGDTPINITSAQTARIAYTVETGSGNATAAVYANDTANNAASAAVRFILDINDTATTDNSSSSFTWFSTNVTINLTAVDAANGSGANRTLWCTYTSGTTPCTPAIEVANPVAFNLPLNCSTDSSCTIRVRYYSIDNVSNNESGGNNGGQIRESNTVNIATGGSDVQDSLVNNSAITNGSYVRQSNITNTTANSCRVINSIVIRSTLFKHPDYRYNCTISESVVIDSNITSAIVEKRSLVDPSTIIDSVITNSTILNSTVSYSRIENSTFCGNFSVWSGAMLNNTLIDGRLEFNGSVYFGPMSLSNICAGVPSSPVGTLSASPPIVNNTASIAFKYSGTRTGYTVTIGSNELSKLDNTSTKSVTLADNGAPPDAVANDAVYSGNYSISALNNESDGNKTIVAQVFDSLGNNWTVQTNVTLDNTPPYAAIVINGNILNTTGAAASLNLTFADSTSGVKDCRFANEDRIFGSYEPCPVVKPWTLGNGVGLKTVIVQARDNAGNMNETNDTITLLLPAATTIITPRSGDIVRGSKSVVVIAPDAAVWVTFQVFNSSNASQNWSLSGTASAVTNDTVPADGFTQAWTTTAGAFANESYFNITVMSYDSSGNYLGNDTQGGIQVDNAPPNVTLDIPRAGTAYNKLVRANATASSDTASVRFEYRESSTGDWKTVSTAYSSPFVVDWNTAPLTDGTAYEVRANATDDAGLSAFSTHTGIEVDNTPPPITITSPVAGSTISGTVNITFTIIGAISSRQIQFDGGAWLSTTSNVSHLWDTTTAANGAHLIRVKANDTLNNTGYSDIVIVQVDNGGANVILIEPVSGGYKSGNVSITVSAPGTTFNVTVNISNSTGFFNTTGNISAVNVDNVSSDGWTATWETLRFAEDSVYSVIVSAYSADNTFLGSDSATSIEVDNFGPGNATTLGVFPSPTSVTGSLTLNWTSSASADIDHYNLYRSVSSNFTIGSGFFIKSITGNSTTDNVPAGTWYYRVSALDNVGRESNSSNEVNTTVQLVGPIGGMDINATYARDNDTIRILYTDSATGLAAIVNASRMQLLDARVIHDFEALWPTSNNNSLNVTLNTTSKAGSFSIRLLGNATNAASHNITVDLSAAGSVNLTNYNRLLFWVQSNATGNLFNFTIGTTNYTDGFNFTINVGTADVWEQKVIDISTIPALNRSAVRYLMFNITTSQPFWALLDGMEASNQISLLDNGMSGDSVANDAIYTALYNISPQNNVSDGLKTVTALVTDSSGNSLAPYDTITLDNTPPNGTVLINEGDLFTITRTVTLNLTFVDAISGVKDCRSSNTEPLTSTYENCQALKVWTTTTGGGTKTVYFEVRDNAGNTNISIDTIVLDVSVPAMLITSPLPGSVVNGTVNVSFAGAESTQPQISFDGGNWTNTTAVTYHLWNTTNVSISEGVHSIRVRDTDSAGNIGYSEPLLVTVDNVPGVVTLVQPGSNQVLTGNVTVIAVAPDNTVNMSFWIFNITSGRAISVYNDTLVADGWNFSLQTAQFEDGVWDLYANATDSFGRIFDTASVHSLRFDNTVPTVTLATPANGATVRGTVIINATASSDVRQVLFEYSNNSGADWQPIGIDFGPSAGWTFAWYTVALNDASTYRVRANATDYAGLSAVGQNSADFTIDNTPPSLTITAPSPGSFVSGIINITFTGNSSLTSELSIDGAGWANITNSTTYAWNTSAYNDGTHTLQVRNNDSAGSTGYSSTVAVVVDNTMPTVVIISPLSNTTIKGNVTVLASTYPDTTRLDFYVDNNTGSGWALRRSDANKADGWDFAWDTALDCATAAECTGVRLRVNSTDAANLTSNFTVSGLEIDNTAPAVTLLYPPSSATIRGAVIASATSSSDTTAVLFEYSPDSGSTWYTIGTDPSSAGGWNMTWDTRYVADASTYRVRANATDNAGLSAVGQNSADFTIDNVEAATTIISPKTGDIVSGNFTVTATAPDSAFFVLFRVFNGSGNFSFSGNGSAGFTNDSTPADGWSAKWNTTAFNDSLYNLSAVSYDVNGNYISNGTEVGIRIDNNAPAAVTLTALPAFFNRNVIALNWSPSISSDVAYYNVYRSNNVSFALSSGALLKNLTGNTTSDTVLNGQWFYKVTAVDIVGRESAASNEVNVTVITVDVGGGALPGELFGTLSVNDSAVNNGSSILFTFAASSTDLNVTISQANMRGLDNTSGALQLNDSGINGDWAADDAVYSAIYAISMLNNESDGMKQLTAAANDIAGNTFSAFVNITLDNTRPNASVSIFGLSPAGFTNISTEYTFSRAVTLQASFNDSLAGVGNCRFANENLAFTGWEDCTTAKAWLLSEGSGNKTVVVEAIDLAGNVHRTNDTIYLNTTAAGLDLSPPTVPTVTDDGTYTNIDSALHAKWNASDYENELLHIPLEWEYRIAFDNFTRRINETWQYAGIATEGTVYSLNLSNGTNYTFEVRAINTAGIRGANGTSDGITVDITPPSAPAVNSTAGQNTWSSNNAVSFNWSSTDTISGVSSYSYVLDTNSTTIPDNVPEAENDHTTLASSSNDGKSAMLKFNSTGNASAVFVEVRSNLSANDVVRVTLQLAESATASPDAMGFRVYLITAVPTSFAMNVSNVSLIVDTSNDISFVSSMLDATSYTVEVPLSTPVTGSRFFVAVAGDVADDNNRHSLLLAASNSSIDSSTQSYQCGEVAGTCSNTTDTAEYGIKVDVRDLKQDDIWDRAYTVADGRMHFHVKAKDRAGNFGQAANYTLLVDTSAPSTPQLNQTSQYTNVSSAAFNWTQSRDADSGIDNYSLQLDNNSDFSSPEFYAWVNNVTNYTVTGLVADATYYARVHSRNLAGVNSSWSSAVSAVIDTTAPSITFSKPSSTGVVASQDVVLIVNTNEKAVCTYSLNSGAYLNFTYTNSTYHETMIFASTGSNTMLLKCHDAILNENTPASTTFTVSTTSTASSITLQSPSVFTGDVVRANVTVATSSGTLLGELGAGAFKVKINSVAIPASVFDNGAGDYTLVFDSPVTNGTYTMDVDVGSATAATTLTVRALLFTVQYVQSGISSNSGDRLIYFLAGNFSLGLATDSKSFAKSSTSSALNMTSDARAGTAYIFVTRQSGGVERVEGLLKERKFLDSANPSFGYAIDQNTFIVFTDLEYDDISLAGNRTLTTGRYNLIIENKGFDATLNKTKLEVRVQ